MTLYSKKGHKNNATCKIQKRQGSNQSLPAATSGRKQETQPVSVPALEERLFALEDFANRCTAYLQSLPQAPSLLEVEVLEAPTLSEANALAQQKRALGFVCTKIQRVPEAEGVLLELKRPVFFKGVEQ